MAIWQIEKLGGLANFGGGRSRVRSVGLLDTSLLPASELKDAEALFQTATKTAVKVQGADGFRYRITRSTATGLETIEVPESLVHPAITSSVKDELI